MSLSIQSFKMVKNESVYFQFCAQQSTSHLCTVSEGLIFAYQQAPTWNRNINDKGRLHAL